MATTDYNTAPATGHTANGAGAPHGTALGTGTTKRGRWSTGTDDGYIADQPGGYGGGYGDYDNRGGYGPTRQPGFPPYTRTLGNPAPLGLYSLATTTLLLGMYTVNARGVHSSNPIVGMALAVGGLTQILAGMWEYAHGNTFAATAFSAYGGFFFSIGIAYIPGSASTAGFSGDDDLQDAFGIYMMVWFIFGFCLWLGTIRSSITLSAVYFFMWMSLLLSMIGLFLQSHRTVKGGGAMAIVAAAFAYYVATSNLLHNTFRPILPLFELSRNNAAGPGTRGNKGAAGTGAGAAGTV